ncbi:MAG: AAA family ATPase [Rhodobacteraceae bacterium]|nr:AAA family ATPase [Paracoccaceae bacterium]
MDDDDIDIRAFFGVLRRQIKIVVATGIMVISGALIYVFSLTPTYTASTLILVDPVEKNLLASGDRYQNVGINDIRVDSEIEILKSDAVALRVVQAVNLIADPEFGISAEDSDLSDVFLMKTVIESFQRAVSASRRGQTYLISVKVTSEGAVRAAELTNALADAYIANQIATKIDALQSIVDILRIRLEEARVALGQSETAFDVFIADNIDLFEAQSATTDLSILTALRASLSAETTDKDLIARGLADNLRQQNWAAIAEGLQNDALQELEHRRQEAQRSLSIAANGSQVMTELRQELVEIDLALADEANRSLSGLRAEIVQLQVQAGETQSQIRQTVLAGQLPAELLTKIYTLQQDSNITRSQYDNFLTRLREVELQAELQVADSRIVSPALPPLNPSSQSKRTILTLAAVLALGLGVGLAFLNEYFIGGFTSEAQLRNILQLPVASRIPNISPIVPAGQEGAIASVAALFVEQPMSEYAESIRRLRISLDRQLDRNTHGSDPDKSRGSVIMVGSTVPGEGKSNTSLALGRAYALSGVKTLLIDCDLRKPCIHQLLGLESDTGMLQFLNGTEETDVLSNILRRDYATGLENLLGAGRCNIPTDQLLVGPKFSKLISSSRELFDIIILDTPPLLPLVDGLYLAHHADAIVLAVKWASTTQSDVRSILTTLSESKNPDAKIVTVLSQIRHEKLRYYRNYGYQNQE